MKRRKASAGVGKALDLWQAPDGAGDPLICIATTYTFDATFFETECIARFLQMDTHPTESASVAYLIEREEKLAGAHVHAIVDRRHARDKESLRWDIIGVLVPGAVQHAKLAVLVWKDHVRVIVGSGNLTEPGYRKNLESFAALDIRRDGGNIGALSLVLDFLREVVDYAVGVDDEDTPKGRLRESIERVRAHTSTWPRSLAGRSEPLPVFNLPGRSAFQQLVEAWPSGRPPRECHVVSPFFDQTNASRMADALKTVLAKRGDRDAFLYVKAEDMPDGRKRVYAPYSLIAGLAENGDLEVVPLLSAQNDEQREVHSKLISLLNEDWCIFMMGSSNFTSAGLGVGVGSRNCEANLAYRVKTSDPECDLLDSVWPEYGDVSIDISDPTILWEPAFESSEDGEGDVPLPGAFQDALFTPGEAAKLSLTLVAPLPEKFVVRVPGGRVLLASDHDHDGIGWHDLPWDSQTPPFVLEVWWRKGEREHVASWPVNVSNPAALPPPEAFRTLTLDELLEILASTRPLPQAVVEVIRKRARGAGPDAELDPLKRLDSQAFLLRRTKRVARALDRLKERLERPVLTRDAFEWRLRGAVGPLVLADAFVRESRLPGEARFCLAELALALRRVDPQAAAAGGLGVDVVRACIDDAIKEVGARAEALVNAAAMPALDGYVAAALTEATVR